eukprot:1254993-Rhodomonas_salina.2
MARTDVACVGVPAWTCSSTKRGIRKTGPARCYAVPSTEFAYRATRSVLRDVSVFLLTATEDPRGRKVATPNVLRSRSAVSGTETAYDATRHYWSARGPTAPLYGREPRDRYAMSGTGIAYGATVR